MCRPHQTLYTGRQLVLLFDAWQCRELLPRKSQNVLIAWAGKTGFDVDMAVAEWTDIKGTYGDRMYRVTQSSKAGRALEESDQAAHVAAFRKDQAALRRKTNLEKLAALGVLVAAED